VAIAARVSKYGISIQDAIWRTPLAVINQLLLFDDIQSGRSRRWKTDEDAGARTLDEFIADALTPEA
jgi:hypothetical protein